MSGVTKPRRRWQQVLTNLRQRKVLTMLLLGFSSGLPLYLVGNTLGFWMRKEGIDLSTIGFLSWVGLAYTMKFYGRRLSTRRTCRCWAGWGDAAAGCCYRRRS